MKVIRIVLAVFALLLLAYFLGPKPDFGPLLSPEIEMLNIPLDELDAFVENLEKSVHGIKPDNEARIIWYDSIPRKTKYSVVYLHGFSASQMEGNPVHLDFAKRYGCNLYLSRLANHGIEGEEAMTDLTPNKYIRTAKEAIAIGQLLGDDVIVISCSTGGTLSLYLAGANPEMIDAMLLFSPNIEIRDQSSKILTKPWGLNIGKMIAGDFHNFDDDREPVVDQYWTTRYRIEALVALQYLLDETMTIETFQKVTQPYLLGYYYKDENNQDPVVSVAAAREVPQFTSTPEDQQRVIAFPDVGEHVMTSSITSKDLKSVEMEAFRFAEEVLGLQPIKLETDSRILSP